MRKGDPGQPHILHESSRASHETRCSYPALGSNLSASGTVVFDPYCMLDSGTYWLALVSPMDHQPGAKQWYWRHSTRVTGTAAHWRNPGNGFTTGCTSWGAAHSCISLSNPIDLAFELFGTSH